LIGQAETGFKTDSSPFGHKKTEGDNRSLS
jgi:hypothetical protein